MVYHHISADMKCRALQLLAEGWELGRIAGLSWLVELGSSTFFHLYRCHLKGFSPSEDEMNLANQILLLPDCRQLKGGALKSDAAIES
jgi:hypothetical protein